MMIFAHAMLESCLCHDAEHIVKFVNRHPREQVLLQYLTDEAEVGMEITVSRRTLNMGATVQAFVLRCRRESRALEAESHGLWELGILARGAEYVRRWADAQRAGNADLREWERHGNA